MAILHKLEGALTVAESEVELAWSYDPSVTPPAGLEHSGWFPRRLAVAVLPDADVVIVRGLNEDEYARVRDVEGRHQQLLAVVKAALVSVNGNRGRECVKAFILEHATRFPHVIDHLGLSVEAVTAGIGAEARARALHAVVAASNAGEVPVKMKSGAQPVPARKGRGKGL